MNNVLLTAEQAQQIEESLARISDKRNTHFAGDAQVVAGEALATIRAARTQEQAEQESVAEVNQYGITVSDDNWGERIDYKCAVCGKEFMSYTAAYNHYSTIHRKGATCIDL